MTAMTADRTATAQIRDEATALASGTSPGELIMAAFLGVFFVIGWLAGRAWFLGAFCLVAAKYGYWSGAKVPPEQRRRKPAEPPRQQ